MKADKIIRTARSSIGIQITNKGEIIVHAPLLTPGFLIDRFINEKKEWITKTVVKVQQRQIKNKIYQEGETFLYLGKTYSLHFGSYTEISLSNVLQFPLGLQFRIEKELTTWYMHQAKTKITERVRYHAEKMETNYGQLLFSDTSSKWGTCTHENNLQFNWRLIMAPLMVLDYVVIHELAHTKEKNHQSSFWRLVGRYTPAYRQHRKWLANNGHLLTT